MFGYLVASTELLTPEQTTRYKACYCGLCRTLKERYGQLHRLTLNYDMTFLVMLLNSLYEPEERSGKDICLPHPKAPRDWWSSEATNYAADMNVALAYIKCMDDWDDDGSLLALGESGFLKKAYLSIQEKYPKQCTIISKSLATLHDIERSGADDPDGAAECFGRLMSGIFCLREDMWSPTMATLGMALGKLVYIMDATVDLDSDTLRDRYNPFRRYYGLPNNEQRFRDILKMLLGECVLAFDTLPLVQDADIMKNILCTGLWTQFNIKYSRKKGPSDVSGSI